MIKSYGSQISYQSLADHTEGLTRDTVASYLDLLERLEVVAFQQAFDQNSKRGAPKKNRKLHFLDPFIATALVMLVRDQYQPIEMPDESHLVESIAFAHLKRFFPTYYVKAEGEIDLVWVENARPQYAEIKWRNQIRPQDLKQLCKYSESVVLTKHDESTPIAGIQARSLVKFLYDLNAVPK
jgi:predicted AAA+ superfamily ATPase